MSKVFVSNEFAFDSFTVVFYKIGADRSLVFVLLNLTVANWAALHLPARNHVIPYIHWSRLKSEKARETRKKEIKCVSKLVLSILTTTKVIQTSTSQMVVKLGIRLNSKKRRNQIIFMKKHQQWIIVSVAKVNVAWIYKWHTSNWKKRTKNCVIWWFNHFINCSNDKLTINIKKIKS